MNRILWSRTTRTPPSSPTRPRHPPRRPYLPTWGPAFPSHRTSSPQESTTPSINDTGSDIIKYKDRNRLTAGITYVPSRYDVRRYWKRIKFQMGAYVDDSYLTASGSRGLKFDRYTFPVSNRNTISESSLGLTFGVTFGESWFVRKRLE